MKRVITTGFLILSLLAGGSMAEAKTTTKKKKAKTSYTKKTAKKKPSKPADAIAELPWGDRMKLYLTRKGKVYGRDGHTVVNGAWKNSNGATILDYFMMDETVGMSDGTQVYLIYGGNIYTVMEHEEYWQLPNGKETSSWEYMDTDFDPSTNSAIVTTETAKMPLKLSELSKEPCKLVWY